MNLGQAGVKINHHLPVSMQSLASRAELLIRTIAETNMALWAGQVNYDKSQGLI